MTGARPGAAEAVTGALPGAAAARVGLDRRWIAGAVLATAIVFAAAFLFLRPQAAPLSDAEYVAIAKGTPQARLFFTRYDSPCAVVRGWTVMVSCDYAAAPGSPTQKLRVYIDPRTSQIVEVEAQFD